MSASWKTIRVFISSTFRDMQAERDHLVRFVFPKLREDLLQHRIHLVDVDLRWGVTADEDASEVCREVIDECHPRFMCILGGRYGWVPEGKDKSITADEVHYGVLDRDVAKRGRAFFYFRDDQATAEMVEEAAGEYREPAGSENAGKLAALKESIKKAGLPVVQYGAKWDKEQKRLVGLEKFGECVHDDLLQSLKRDPDLANQFTEDGGAAPDEFAEEAAQMEAFIEERTEHYVTGSRDGVLRGMKKFADAIGLPNILVLTGEPGSGKSALVAKFCRSLPVSASPSLLVSHFVGASVGSTDLRRTLRRLCNELAKAAENTEPLPLDIKELITHFQKLLIEAAAKQRVTLVFDALNQLDETDGAHWMNWLPRELPQDVRIIASVIAPVEGENEHRTLAILRNRKDARVEALKPLDESDTQAIIEGYLKRYSKRLSPEQIAALKAKPASNLPLYILTALEELRTLGTYKEITTRIRDDLPGDTRALFGWILIKRLAHDPGFRDREGRPCGAALVEKFAACLGVSRHGLSPAELTALLDPGDPLGNVAALLRLLRPYLMRRGELLDFYHAQFREAAGAAHLDTPEKQRTAHQSVATCLAAFADPHRDGQCRDATPHALSELPYHLGQAEEWAKLAELLGNIWFLETKASAEMAFELLQDFREALARLPGNEPRCPVLQRFYQALRGDIHFLSEHASFYPQAVFQSLWNTCYWEDSPELPLHMEGFDHADRRFDPPLHQLLEQFRVARERRYRGFCWIRSLRPLPASAAGGSTVLRGHTDIVFDVAISPDGRRIATASRDGTVRVWDTDSGREIACLVGHTNWVRAVAWTPDGRTLASGGGNADLKDENGKLIGTSDYTVRLWDVDSGTEIWRGMGHEIFVTAIAFSPDGHHLVSGDAQGMLRRWVAADGRCLETRDTETGSVSHLSYSPDGQHLRTVARGSSAKLWEVTSGKVLHALSFPPFNLADGSCSPEGDRVALAMEDGGFAIYEWSGAQVVSVPVGKVSSIAWSADGEWIVAGLYDGHVVKCEARTGAKRAAHRGHEGPIFSLALSADSRMAASCSMDGSVRLWPLQQQAEEGEPQRVRGHTAQVNALAVSPDGCAFATAAEDETVRVWSAKDARILATLPGHKPAAFSVAFVSDERYLATGTNAGDVRIWDVSGEKLLATLTGTTQMPEGLNASPSGSDLAFGSADGTVQIVEVPSCREVARLEPPRAGASWLSKIFKKPAPTDSRPATWSIIARSADGRVLAGAGMMGEVQVWKVHTRQPWATFTAPVGGASLCLSKDGALLALGGLGPIQVWEVEAGQLRHELKGHTHMVSKLAFTPDGTCLVSEALDGTIRVWSSVSGLLIGVIGSACDAESYAAGTPLLPRVHETHVFELVSTSNAQPVAFFPAMPGQCRALGDRRTWVGVNRTGYVYALRLEGAAPESDVPVREQLPKLYGMWRDAALAAFGQGDLQRAIAFLEHRAAICREFDDVRGLLKCHDDHYAVCLEVKDLVGALKTLEEMAELCRRLGDVPYLLQILEWRVSLLMQDPNSPLVDPLLVEMVMLARSHQDRTKLLWALQQQIFRFQGSGRLFAETLLEEAYALANDLGNPEAARSMGSMRMEQARQRNDFATLEQTLAPLAKAFMQLGQHKDALMALGYRAELLLKRGDATGAELTLAQRERLAVESGEHEQLLSCLWQRCQMLASIDDEHGFLEARARHREVAVRLGNATAQIAGQELVAEFYVVRQEWRKAEQSMSELIELCRSSETEEPLAQALSERGLILAREFGQYAEAAPLMQEAVRIAASKGLAKLLEKSQQTLRVIESRL